jgi:hypothetical protein
MTRYIYALFAVVATGASQVCGAQELNADCASVAAPADHANMNHAAHLAALEKCARGPVPTASGQAAYAAISEVVRMLKADPKTDWTKVNVEALRQHLIDMDAVTMQANAVQRNIPGGIEVDVTGSGRTIDAIRRMTMNHTSMLDAGADYHASAQEIANGARLVITAKNAEDASIVARIRGLGFAGIMTEGDHHASHHLALARGEPIHSR